MTAGPSVGAVLSGRVWKFGDWISGDDGIVRFSDLRDFADDHDERELARLCFADIEPGFASRVRRGDLVVAGRGFGIPAHPPVPVALKASGIAGVVAESSDSAFVRRSLNAGLPVLTCPGITRLVEAGDELRVDLAAGTIENLTRGGSAATQGFTPLMLEIVACGGLVPYLRRRFGVAEGARA